MPSEEISQTNQREISPILLTNQQEKTFDCNVCDDEQDFRLYHKGIYDEDIEEERKNAKPHCQECNQIIPFHLLRGYFYRIIESGAFFKLLVTGKGTGKSINLMLFQAWYLMNHKEGHFVWVYRRKDDLLEKGKSLWEKAIKELKKKHKKGIQLSPTPFDIKDWKDNRGEVASAKGVKFQGERRVFFITLQYANKSDSALSGDASHYVFDEAMPSDGKQLENPNEEARWAQILDNIMREGRIPAICFFLANPHTKGMWWLEKYTKPQWLEEAFINDGKKHYYEDMVDIQMDEGDWEKFPCSFYQAPAERGKYGRMLDTVKNPRRHKTGTYEESVNEYTHLPRPKKWKQLYLVKDYIYARELKQRITRHQKFWYKKGEEEKLDPDILHICFSPEEFSSSKVKNKSLIDNPKEMKYWIRHIFLWGLIENKTLPDYFTGETENKAHQAKQAIMSLINANIQNFDKSG